LNSSPLYYVLLSGGVDSTTALARAIDLNGAEDVRAVSIDYGQRHKKELESAAKIAEHYAIPHEIMPISLPRTMLTDPSIPVPHISYSEIVGVSPTYVPFRNGTMLSMLTSLIAGRHLDPTKKDDPDFNRDILIFWGAHADDAAGGAYPDCTLEFIGAMSCAIDIGTYHKVRVVAPFGAMYKDEIIRQGYKLGAPYDLTYSCYAGGDLHCGECATCRARKEAFRLAGVPDPTIYENAKERA
jgi:7-cyano-7-deazaguanine synthase